jgi:HEAT repeat protein
VAIGNEGSARHLALLEILLNDEDPIVREHAAWARDRLLDRLPEEGSRGSGRV